MLGRSKEDVPWRGEKGVFITLAFIRAGGSCFFQHLGLAAMMIDLGQEPEIVPLLPGVPLDAHEVSADESAVIAAALRHALIGTVALKDMPGQALAVVTVAEPTGVAICLLYTSPSPRDRQKSRMPSSA